jgi:cell division transport system permease protein
MVDISIYLRNSVTDQQVEELEAKLLAVDEQVKGVRYIDLDQARQDYIDKENPTPEQLQAISELSTTPFPPSLRVSVVSPDRIDQIEQLVETDEDFQNLISPTSPPSYAGDRREAIESIGRAARFTDTIGIVAGLTFTAISMLIIFNTIRMAIFNRRDEIQMMKLIGADKRFIRGPFVVEAVMYGIIAAFLATALGYAAVFAIEPQLNRYDVIVSPTRDLLTFYSPVVVVAMALIGSIIGAVSSRFAVRRYLSV